jgi:hypothetical protein
MKLYTWTATIFLQAHLQVVYYNCVKFHKNPMSRLGGVALTRYTTPLFVKVQVELSPLLNFGEQPYSFDAHLQVVYYKCVQFHKNSISGLGGVALEVVLIVFGRWF